MPGVVIDRYGEIVVLQLSSAGAMRWRDAIADAIEAVVRPKTIFERSDSDVLALEGIAPRRIGRIGISKALFHRTALYPPTE